MSFTTPGSASRSLHAPRISKVGWRKVLLGCGAAASLLYFAMDVIASRLYNGYSYTDQAISELSAIGAPTRSFWIPLGLVYSVLMLAFGAGVWASAGQKRALRVVASMAAAVGVVGFVWPSASMHQREVLAAGGATFGDTLHVILGGVDTLLLFVSIAFGATALGKRFRFYSIATIVVTLVFGALNAVAAPKLQDNDPTPWMGVFERISIHGSLLWYAVLAVSLWNIQAGADSDKGKPTQTVRRPS